MKRNIGFILALFICVVLFIAAIHLWKVAIIERDGWIAVEAVVTSFVVVALTFSAVRAIDRDE